MAIDINNANYKLFTDFAAAAAKQTTRAAIGTLLTARRGPSGLPAAGTSSATWGVFRR